MPDPTIPGEVPASEPLWRLVGLLDTRDTTTEINGRVLAMLRAVSDGRAELVCSCEPDLVIDGLGCCDQYTAHLLSADGLIRPAVRGAVGQRVRAELTGSGHAALNHSPAIGGLS